MSNNDEKLEQDFFPVVKLAWSTLCKIALYDKVLSINSSHARRLAKPPREALLIAREKPYFILLCDVKRDQVCWLACADQVTMGKEFAGGGRHYPIERRQVFRAREEYIDLTYVAADRWGQRIRDIIVSENILPSVLGRLQKLQQGPR